MALKVEEISVPGYERVVYGEESRSGMRSIIAIHNTNLGPACGGIRMLPYASKDEALKDVLNLARGMSYKSALAGIGFGGGKSVMIGDPAKKTNDQFHAFAEFLSTFDGRYIAAKDMNVSSEDLAEVKTQCPHVLGIEGEPGSSGDPSPVTARGIQRALEATLAHLTGERTVSGLRIAIQGIGTVGYEVAELVKQSGGELWVTDIDPEVLKRAEQELGATVVSLEKIYEVDCDIFSPCARGAILNANTIEKLRCKAIVGCANNQLASNQDGFRLHEKAILYAPDFVVNSGGIINIFIEFEGYDRAKALKKADEIFDTTKEVLRRSKEEKKAPFVVADKLAEERLYGKR